MQKSNMLQNIKPMFSIFYHFGFDKDKGLMFLQDIYLKMEKVSK